MSLLAPSSPSENSSSVSDSPNAPHTPLTSDLLPDSSPTNSVPAGKRKPSRRANTAERRATHNAVERQRRETLNGRFLDLAGLLPNLSQIRRPSKSAIVNSSIAHVHASRRHRLIAARELRLLQLEADALRRELNEWRDRSGLPRVEEPVRGDGFGLALSGEVEVMIPSNLDDDEGMGEEDGEDDLLVNTSIGAVGSGDDMDDLAQAAAVALLKPNVPAPSSSPPNTFVHNVHPLENKAPSLINHARSQPVSNGPRPHKANTQMVSGRQHHAQPQHLQIHSGVHETPMIASHPSAVSYENPAIASLYDDHSILSNHPHTAQYGFGPGHFDPNQLQPQMLAQFAAEMESKAGSGWYNNMEQFISPSSSSGGSPVDGSFGIGGGLVNGGYQHQQQHVYLDERRASMGSVGSGRERSSSLGSINRGSPVGSYELVGGPNMGGVPRWMGDDGFGDGLRIGPGAGNGAGYAMMM